MAVLILTPWSAFADPSFVKTAHDLTGASSVTIAFNPTNTGDTLVIYVQNSSDANTDRFTSATWNGGSISPIDQFNSTAGLGSCTNLSPIYEFVVQNVNSGSQNFVFNASAVKNWATQITEYTGVSTTGQPATHNLACLEQNTAVAGTVAVGSMLVIGGGAFANYPTNCPASWNLRTPTNCTSIGQAPIVADVVATSTATSATWPSAAGAEDAFFLVSLAVPASPNQTNLDTSIYFFGMNH